MTLQKRQLVLVLLVLQLNALILALVVDILLLYPFNGLVFLLRFKHQLPG